MIYLDSSALVKILRVETESDDLRQFLRSQAQQVTSSLTHTELVRVVRREWQDDPDAIAAARGLLETLDEIVLTAQVYRSAALLGNPLLRSLDAIHLAAALTIRSQLQGMVTYDKRLYLAAQAVGITAYAPGAQII